MITTCKLDASSPISADWTGKVARQEDGGMEQCSMDVGAQWMAFKLSTRKIYNHRGIVP